MPAVVTEESIEFLKNTVMFSGIDAEIESKEALSCLGRIGIKLFESYVCLFDFSNSCIVLTKEPSQNISKQWIETELDTTKGYALVSFETDLGIKTFFLDTAASACAFRESLIDKIALVQTNRAKQSSSGRWFFRSLKMMIGNVDFGEQRFVLFEFGKPFEHIDGILGIDFFQKYPLCLDFPNGKAYLRPLQNPFWEKILGQFGSCKSQNNLKTKAKRSFRDSL